MFIFIFPNWFYKLIFIFLSVSIILCRWYHELYFIWFFVVIMYVNCVAIYGKTSFKTAAGSFWLNMIW